MVSILIITLMAFVTFLLLTGLGIMRDFSRLWIRQSREVFGGRQGVNYYCELAVTLAVVFIIAASVALFKGGATVLLAMATTHDIAQFTTALRGVFSSYTTELQSSKNYLLQFFLNPALKILATYLLTSGVRSFFGLINKKAGDDCYGEADALYFSSLGVLFLIAIELLCRIQDVKMANMAGNIAYLLLDKFSYIIYFLSLEEAAVLRSNKNRLNEAVNKYLVTTRVEKKTVMTGWKMVVLAYALGLSFSLPSFLGFAWIRDDAALIGTFVIVLGVAFIVMRKAYSESWNLLGTVLFSSTISMPIGNPKPLGDKSKKRIGAGLIAVGVLLAVFGIVYPKQLFMLVLIMAFGVCFSALGIVIIYFLVMGIGYCVACITGGNATVPTAGKSVSYLGWVLSSLPQAIAISGLVVTMAFVSMTCFPKELKTDDIIENSCVIDANGNCLYVDEEHDHYCVPVRYEDLPEFFKTALVLQEDRFFFRQDDLWPNASNWHGISFSVLRGRGGSNINAQLCKNITFLKADGFPRDMSRKLAESISGYMLSLNETPESIMELYTNVAAFHGTFAGFRGLNAASLHAFGKPIGQLNQLQQLYLVNTLPRSMYIKTDNANIPYRLVHENAEGEVKEALLKKAERWLEGGMISRKAYNSLKREELAFTNTRYRGGIPTSTRLMLERNYRNQPGRHDCSIVMENERALGTAYRQLQAQEVFRKNGSELQVAALVVDAPSGRVIGHFSSSDVLDYANHYTYPIGSIGKPAIVLELIGSGVPLDFKLFDGKVGTRKTPRNSHGWSNVEVDAATMISRSLNAPFSNITDLGINPRNVFRDLENEYAAMGITEDTISANDIYNYPLGNREMRVWDVAQVYQTIFNNGICIPLSLEQTADSMQSIRIWDETHVNVVKNAMNKTIENQGGTLNRFKNSLPQGSVFYGKTGTSSRQRDGWTVLSDGKTIVVCWASYGKLTGQNMELGQQPLWGSSTAGMFAVLIVNELMKLNNH